MSYATITALNVYPVKSCRGIPLDKATLEMSGVKGDRRWLVINESGRFMTQRELPRLALIVPRLTERDGVDLIAAATAMSGAFWQMATPGPEVAALYRSDPRLAHAVVDVEPRVARLLEAMLEGMLA